MRTDKYIINDRGDIVVEPDLLKWGRWMNDRHLSIVKQEQIGDSKVSTVFLGLDHNYDEDGPPVLWETMVFGGKLDKEMDRCSGNREQAEAMHQRMVERVKTSHLTPRAR